MQPNTREMEDMMKRELDQHSVIPLYHQLKEIIKENIERGDWAPGDKIPSENELRYDYHISRNTAKKAIEDLVQLGVLNRIQGKGTFVSQPKLEQPLMGFYSFSKVMKEMGMAPTDIILHMIESTATSRIANKLMIDEGDALIELKRLRCANGEPVILETSYIPEYLVRGIEQDNVKNTSLYDVMESDFGIIVTKAKEVFEPVLIRDYESEYLQVKEGYPALLLERTAYERNGKPVEFCHSIVRGDRCRFYTELI